MRRFAQFAVVVMAWVLLPFAALAADAISNTDQTNHRIFQRSFGTTAKTVVFAGTYTGTAPTTIEIEVQPEGGGTPALDWSACGGSPTIAGGNWSGCQISVPQGGMYNYRSRSKDGGGTVLATSSLTSNDWGVGDLLWLIGQSNQARMCTLASSPPAANANVRVYGGINPGLSVGWQSLSGLGNGCVILANKVADGLGIPVGIVISAQGASGLLSTAVAGGQEYWLDLTAGQVYPDAITDLTNVGSDVAAAIWHQGENDAINGPSSQSDYKTGLGTTLYTRLKSSVTRGADMPLFVAIIGKINSVNTDDGTTAIRNAQIEVALETSGAQFAGSSVDMVLADTVHWDATGFGYERMGRRYAQAYLGWKGASTSGVGPRITSASRTSGGSVVTLTVTQAAGTGLLTTGGSSAGTGLTGFRVFDNGVAKTISSTAFVQPNTITLTLSSAMSVAGPVVFDYQYGKQPTTSTAVYDNTTPGDDTIGLPLWPTDGQMTVSIPGAAGKGGSAFGMFQ